ncbi:hypothetical protein ACPCVO_19580 [Streptomyces umbrinus]|uniref:hypothetical protein n=1 Tax=Streptomyces umbrinus TaxID=67370 RepID=UPI003C2BBB05
MARLLDLLGYDAVDIGALADSWRSEPNTPVYVQPYMAERPEGLSPEGPDAGSSRPLAFRFPPPG